MGIWRFALKRQMWTFIIIEYDVVPHTFLKFASRAVLFPVQFFIFIVSKKDSITAL